MIFDVGELWYVFLPPIVLFFAAVAIGELYLIYDARKEDKN